MKNPYILLLALFLMIVGCKSDKEKTPATKALKQNTEKVDESLRLLKNIESAHNAQKFQSEPQVKFKIKLTTKDSIFFDGFATLKTDGSKVRFLDSNIDKVLEGNELQTELDKQLFMIAEAYTMGFWFESDNLTMMSKSDSLDISSYDSVKSNSQFKIYTHPMTHIIQKIDFKTTISDSPFNSGTLYYDKYITVNRVPVALHWRILDENTKETKAEISRISYPEQF